MLIFFDRTIKAFRALCASFVLFFCLAVPTASFASYTPPEVSSFLYSVRMQSPSGYIALKNFTDYASHQCGNVVTVDMLKKLILYSDIYINLLSIIGSGKSSSSFENYINTVTCESILALNTLVILEEDKHAFK